MSPSQAEISSSDPDIGMNDRERRLTANHTMVERMKMFRCKSGAVDATPDEEPDGVPTVKMAYATDKH